MPYLILSDRHAEIDRVELLDEAVTIGRSPECAVQVRDAMLSRHHCRIEPTGDGHWVLVDLRAATARTWRSMTRCRKSSSTR
jgi:pSer/pThr/pTyr-binding forkhead associated (FHA) protein